MEQNFYKLMKRHKILNIRLFKFLCFFILFISYNSLSIAMTKNPYHHLPDGTFRNPEGSPKRDENVKWSYKVFIKEKKNLI